MRPVFCPTNPLGLLDLASTLGFGHEAMDSSSCPGFISTPSLTRTRLTSFLPSSDEQFYLTRFLASSSSFPSFHFFTPSSLVVVVVKIPTKKVPSLSLHILIYIPISSFFYTNISSFFFSVFIPVLTYLSFDTTKLQSSLKIGTPPLLIAVVTLTLSDLLLILTVITCLSTFYLPPLVMMCVCVWVLGLPFLPLFWDGCFIRTVLLITAYIYIHACI